MAPIVANVAEAGDIVILAMALAGTLVVGLGLLAVDTAVGRLRQRVVRHRRAGVVDSDRGAGPPAAPER